MTIKRPSVKVIVYNYEEREGTNLIFVQAGLALNTIGNALGIKEIDITESVVAVQTSKSKGSPSGTFSITLSAENNWLATLSPGSWVAILMADREITQKDVDVFNEQTLKMIGRIDSVRVARQVDQATGAFVSNYMVQGRDWGCMLEAPLYYDPTIAAVPESLAKTAGSNYALPGKLGLEDDFLSVYDSGSASTTKVAEALVRWWGKQGTNVLGGILSSPDASDKLEGFDVKQLVTATELSIPRQLTRSMQIGRINSKFVDNIKLVSGRLQDYDSYGEPEGGEAFGAIAAPSLIGVNSLWQLLNRWCTAGGINEVVADLRFEKTKPGLASIAGGGLSFAVYKRVLPFTPGSLKEISPSLAVLGTTPQAKSITSNFLQLRRTEISLSDIISCDAGTNWRDTVNFLEIRNSKNLFPQEFNPAAVEIKMLQAAYSSGSYAVSGFKPVFIETEFLPKGLTGEQSVSAVQFWRPVIVQWFFDTHKMLNGQITLSGKSSFIGVGENIGFPTSVLATGKLIPGIPTDLASDNGLLCHVESVSHSFSVSNNGERSFVTVVGFSRGIVTTSDYKSKLGFFGALIAGNAGIGAKAALSPNSNTRKT